VVCVCVCGVCMCVCVVCVCGMCVCMCGVCVYVWCVCVCVWCVSSQPDFLMSRSPHEVHQLLRRRNQFPVTLQLVFLVIVTFAL